MEKTAPAVRADDDAAHEKHDGESAVLREILPSGLTSMVLHILLLLGLALWWLPATQETSASTLLVRPDDQKIEEPPTDLCGCPTPDDPPKRPLIVDTSDPTPHIDVSRTIEQSSPPDCWPRPDAPEPKIVDTGNIDPTNVVLTKFGLLTMGPAAFKNRDLRRRVPTSRPSDATPASQDAVEAALRWLEEHQNTDGSWSYDHREGGKCSCRNPGQAHGKYGSTALALLAFLGAGNSHETGRYKMTIDRGLAYLVSTTKTNEDRTVGKMLDEGHAGMYAHGLAAMALAEAYGMTGDSRLRQPAQASLNWIIESQAAGGFWGYTGGGNDTSVSGWQVMALKSGYVAGLRVPDKTIAGIRSGLDTVAGSSGAFYGYRKPEESFRPATTAIGLLSRIYTGWPNDHSALRRGMAEVVKKGPDFGDMYYTYYATQAMYQYTSGRGAAWERYNIATRDGLVASQARAGHEAGSWNHGKFNNRGGRIYSTALAAMCLEIYYRYEPIYQKSRTFGRNAAKGGFAGSKPGTPTDRKAAWDLD